MNADFQCNLEQSRGDWGKGLTAVLEENSGKPIRATYTALVYLPTHPGTGDSSVVRAPDA